MVRIQIHLTDDQGKRLKKMAAQQGRSMADLVRDGVDLVLGREHESRAALMQRASRVFGKFRSKHGDLSRRHDRHFGDASEPR